MNNKLNIEELFKEKFEGHEAKPSGGAYAKIQRAYNRRQFMRFNPRRVNIYYTLGAILIGTAVAFTLFTNNQSNIEEPQTTNTPTLNELSNSDTIEPTPIQEPSSNQQQVTKKEQQQKSHATQPPTQPKTSNQQAAKNQPPNNIDGGNQQSDKLKPEPLEDFSGPVSTMVAYFTPSVREGCAPLSIEFKNLSANASIYEWNLGTNQSANSNRQPAIVYTEPGSYTVTLSAYDNNGLTLTHSETITVHPAPKAEFELTGNYIYNYSTDATNYKWLLIDKDTIEVSSEFQIPLSEVYKNQRSTTSNQQVALIATNIYTCSDTTAKKLPEPSIPTLIFPTAFSPNPGGPTGGFYSQNDVDNNVFHPAFQEEPLEYNLKIYSKTGELIFESDDIYKGWDGYHKQEVSPKGVYIYHVSGQWENGNTFNFKGDVTILWNE